MRIGWVCEAFLHMARNYDLSIVLPRTATKVRHSICVTDDLLRLKPLLRQPTEKGLPGPLRRSTERGPRSGASSTTFNFYEFSGSHAHSFYTTRPIQATSHENLDGNRQHLLQVFQRTLWTNSLPTRPLSSSTLPSFCSYYCTHTQYPLTLCPYVCYMSPLLWLASILYFQ